MSNPLLPGERPRDLRGAKPGDLVVRLYGNAERIVHALRVSPGGRVTVEHGEVYRPDGWLVGRGHGFIRASARLATDADIERVRAAELVSNLRAFDRWTKLSLADLLEVEAVFARAPK